jgi:Tol biopolymer transport system component
MQNASSFPKGRLAFAAADAPGKQLDLYFADGPFPVHVLAGTWRDEYSPIWSPDSDRIAYRVSRPGAFPPDIWVMEDDGSHK